MKIALASDLHLEFSDIELKNTGNADVFISCRESAGFEVVDPAAARTVPEGHIADNRVRSYGPMDRLHETMQAASHDRSVCEVRTEAY